MTTHDLLVELQRRGVRLTVAGDKLRCAPRSAVEPDLLPALREHKPRLMVMLARRAEAPGDSAESRAVSAPPPAGTSKRPPAPERPAAALPGLSLAERAATGYVNPGWTPRLWAFRLRELADRCAALRPDLAAQYRTWAANVLKNAAEFA